MTGDTPCPDSTPSPTSPSPISPTSTAVSNGDFLINVQPDPEKGDAIEQDSNVNGTDVLRQAGEPDVELIQVEAEGTDRNQTPRMIIPVVDFRIAGRRYPL